MSYSFCFSRFAVVRGARDFCVRSFLLSTSLCLRIIFRERERERVSLISFEQ